MVIQSEVRWSTRVGPQLNRVRGNHRVGPIAEKRTDAGSPTHACMTYCGDTHTHTRPANWLSPYCLCMQMCIVSACVHTNTNNYTRKHAHVWAHVTGLLWIIEVCQNPFSIPFILQHSCRKVEYTIFICARLNSLFGDSNNRRGSAARPSVW